MFFKEKEIFYTESEVSELLVDVLVIDVASSSFRLALNEDEVKTEPPYEACFVNRFIFDIIVRGVRELGFKEEQNA